MRYDHPSIGRRRFLSDTMGVGSVALLSLLRDDGLLAQASPNSEHRPHFEPSAKACIFIFLVGGASQLELFDRKPILQRLHGQPIPQSFRPGIRLGQTNFNAPIVGTSFSFQRYGQCGMEMSSLLPHFGSCADDITLIRSMHHEAFDHAPGELEFCTGKDNPGRPSMGSWLLYGLGSESRNLPGYVVLLNGRSPKSRSYVWGNGFLPTEHQGVLFRNQGTPILNLQTAPGVTPEMHRAQLDAIRQLNEIRGEQTRDSRTEAQIAAYELAFRMQTAAPELLDLSSETRATIDSYGSGDFARSLLLARRLVERGVRFVTVTHHEWDHHGNLPTGLPQACRQIDQPIAALLRDLKRRGLLDSTLVIGGTEFGRTAISQGGAGANYGRDHHPHAFSIWLAGAGVKRGFTLGETDELSWRVTKDPVHTHDFHATLLHLFGLDHRRLTFRHQGLDMRLTDVSGNVVQKLLS